MLSKRKQAIIKNEVRVFLEIEEVAAHEDHDWVLSEEERRDEAIGECALKLGLCDETVARWWEKFEFELL